MTHRSVIAQAGGSRANAMCVKDRARAKWRLQWALRRPP